MTTCTRCRRYHQCECLSFGFYCPDCLRWLTKLRATGHGLRMVRQIEGEKLGHDDG